MNIPTPRADGWTFVYLAQLNQVVDSIIERPDTRRLHGMTAIEWDTTWNAAANEHKIFKYYERLFVPTAPDPLAWINKRVAARCWMRARLAAL